MSSAAHDSNCPAAKRKAKCTCGAARSYPTSRAPPGIKPKVEAPRPATVPAVAELAPELPAKPIYPIDLSTLPPAPAIVAKNFHSHDGVKVVSEEALQEAACGLDPKLMLDLSRGNPAWTAAAESTKELIMGASVIESRLAKLLLVNDGPVFGCCPAGNYTKGHHHFMGVLNGKIGKPGDGSVKMWYCFPLGTTYQKALESESLLTIPQYSGDLLYVPPGWGHEVRTLEGTKKSTKRKAVSYTSHFVTWVMPPHYIGTPLGHEVLSAFCTGRRADPQAPLGPKKIDWGKVWDIINES